MKKTNKYYWRGLEQIKQDPLYVQNEGKEFGEWPAEKGGKLKDSSRRDFLKAMGFSVAAASLAACEAPVRKAIPYLNKPVDVDPGVPNYYASTYVHGNDYAHIVVKTREGRPIKIQGNQLSPLSQGGTSAKVEASVLDLYDTERLKGPVIEQTYSNWADLDTAVKSELNQIKVSGGKTVIVSETVLSPSTRAAIKIFQEAYDAEWVVYDPVSYKALKEANRRSFDAAVIPAYNFSKANIIVSFDADFLGTWLNTTQNSKQYARTRSLSDKSDMSRHYHYESNLSLTGSNADYRIPIKPSHQAAAITQLYNALAKKAGEPTVSGGDAEIPFIEKAADDLWKNKGKGLVVCGINHADVQVLVNAINAILGNYGKTLDFTRHSMAGTGDEAAMDKFIADAAGGKVDGVIFFNCNPVYNHPNGATLAEAIGSMKLTVSTSDRTDETSLLTKYIAPDHHYLEAWNDAEPVAGIYSLTQPAITPLFKTRQAQESFLKWAGNDTPYYDFVQQRWRENIYAKGGINWPATSRMADSDTDTVAQKTTTSATAVDASKLNYGGNSFETFWNTALFNGVVEVPVTNGPASASFAGDVAAAARGAQTAFTSGDGLELVVYQKVGIGSGNQANNPWLQEMPDPVTKATWDNYITIPLSLANELNIVKQDQETVLATLTVGEQEIVAPVLIQPGQARGTIGIAMGYGRNSAGKVGNEVGVNVFPLIKTVNGFQQLYITDSVSLTPSDESYKLALTQTHHTVMGRESVLQEATLDEYKEDPTAGGFTPKISTGEGKKDPMEVTLWKGWKYPNHHWGMIVDLNTCTGCSACTVACMAENNVPVVGKEEILNRREMTWIRIDRYYSSKHFEDPSISDYREMENAVENPEVTFQPMMCQQCNNAPCETVCPVSATTHSSEGINQMTYNRCIGTRYCANNCPYKVRRFNWFKYFENKQFKENTSMNNFLGQMVLNPDVTVRSRGVMEKCSFCVQRVQAGKLQAKAEGRRPTDADVNTACAEACPSDALVFGDLNDPESAIARKLKIQQKDDYVVSNEPRAYHVLEELRVDPNVWYLRKIRNKENDQGV